MHLPNDSTERCTICNGKATATWHGTNDIHVCQHCGLNVLPALIVDSLNVACHQSFFNTLSGVEHRYWKAMAYRLLAEKRKAEGLQ